MATQCQACGRSAARDFVPLAELSGASYLCPECRQREPIGEHLRGDPRRLVEVLEKALAWDAADRYPDAGPFRDALRGALATGGVRVRTCGCP